MYVPRAQRRTIGLAGLLLACVGGVGLHRFWTSSLSHLTGSARWIWATDSLVEVRPEAAIFVASLQLDEPPSGALLKICGDREYVAYINGTPAACGWSRPGFRLDLYDVAHLLHQGSNVIAVELRSPTPVGGLLLAMDVDGVGHNVLVSGPAFRVRRRFSLAGPGEADVRVPVIWGAPPRFPWGYPVPQPHPRTLDEMVVEDPVRAAVDPGLSVENGQVFHLGRSVRGFLVLELPADGPCTVATHPESSWGNLEQGRAESQPVVRVTGQDRWLDPEPRQIGTVMVFGAARAGAVEVWPVAEELSSAVQGAGAGRPEPEPRTRLTTRIPPE